MTVLASLATAVVVVLVFTALDKSPGRRKPGLPPRDWSIGPDVTRAQFFAVSLAAGLLAFLLVFTITNLVAVAAVPAVVVAMLPKVYFERRRARRSIEVQAAWPDGLRDLIASVRSGASIHTALEELGRFGPAPLREVFASFPVYSRSLGVEAALEMIRRDLLDPTSDRVIEVLLLAHERGGAVIPEILEDLAAATTKDAWTMEQIAGEALEQKINARVVFVLPWLVLVVMTMRSGAFREFYSTSAGLLVVMIGGILSVVGMLLATRIGRQPSEPRVFAGVGRE